MKLMKIRNIATTLLMIFFQSNCSERLCDNHQKRVIVINQLDNNQHYFFRNCYKKEVEKHNNLIEELEYYVGEQMGKIKKPAKPKSNNLKNSHKKLIKKYKKLMQKVKLLEEYMPIVRQAYDREEELTLSLSNDEDSSNTSED